MKNQNIIYKYIKPLVIQGEEGKVFLSLLVQKNVSFFEKTKTFNIKCKKKLFNLIHLNDWKNKTLLNPYQTHPLGTHTIFRYFTSKL